VSKGKVRERFRLTRVRENDASGGGAVAENCGARTVDLRSDLSAHELRAIGATYLYVAGREVVLQRLGRVVANVITEVGPLRRCIEQGTRFEADLQHLTIRGGLAVRVRPVTTR
jgi:hypothetical protein